MLQVYAEALGLCDAVREQIKTLEEQIAALEAALANRIAAIEKEIADLKAQLESAVGAAKAEIEAKIAALEAELAAIKASIEEKIAKINAAIEALKAELEAAIASGLMKLDELKNAILALDDAVAELIDSLKNVTAEAIIDALAKIDATVKALDAALYELASEKYEELKKALCEFAMSVLEQTIDAIVKFFPELDEALYNYFYNNPDEVIAFFAEYGDVMLDIANEYGLEALAVVGYVLYAYGEDIAAYVIENSDAILSAVKGWTEKYGERTAAMLQVYAEALGLCDAVREQIKTLEEQIAALEAELAKATGEAKALIEAKIAEVKAAIAELKAALDALEAAIKNIVTDVNNKVETAIAKLEQAIRELNEKVEALIEETVNNVETAINDAIEAAVNELNALVNELINVVDSELKALVAKLIYDSTHGTYVIDRESLYVALGGSSVMTPSYVEYLAEMLDIDFEDLTGNPDMLSVVLENMELIANADLITLDYNTGVATDFAVSQALGFAKLYMNNVLRPQAKDYAYNVANIIFGDLYEGHEIMNVIPSVIDSKFEEMLANEVFASATYDELDWLSLVGEEGLPYVEKARAALVEKLIEAGVAETTIIPVNVVELLYSNIDAFGQYGWLLPNEDKLAAKLGDDAMYYIEIPTLDLVSYMVESYVYSLMLYNKQYTETIATIRAINPDALVVLLGHYNALNGLAFVEGDLEAVYEAYAEVLSIYPFAHALLGENTVYVDIPETETLLGATVNGAQLSIEDFIMTYLNASIATQPSEAGQYYIYQQILNALTIIDTRGLLGDADGDGDVDSTDAMLILQYDALIIDETQLDLSVCDVDGDGDVDSTDAMYIVQYDGLLIDKLPAEK
jgi:DNA anti-recombination protein RmuC